jgi:hypothetical protein
MSAEFTAWHADTATLRRYAAGELPPAASASVEAHLLGCAHCRTQVGDAVPVPRLAAIWAEVAEAVDSPGLTPVERVLLRLGVRDHTARLLAATPSLTTAWLLSVAAALTFALAAAQSGTRGVVLFLALAPVLPVAGVAVAYSRGCDPTYDVSLAAPYPAFRLVLLRTAAVLVTTMALVALAALALPAAPGLAAAWLLPALALTGTTLALSARVPAPVAAGAVVALWLGSVFTAFHETGSPYAAFGAVGQIVALASVLVSTALVTGLHRRAAFDLRRES